MTFGESVRSCFAKFVTWQGRASRSEYWYFVLFELIVLAVSAIVDNILGTSFKFMNPATGMEQSLGYGYLYMLSALVMFLPALAVMVRRLHDTDRSGWWYWIALIPLVGVILLLVWFCTKGTTGPNTYGEDPLGGGAASAFA